MVFGFGESIYSRALRKTRWWFAWRPIIIWKKDHKWSVVWLKRVYRLGTVHSDALGSRICYTYFKTLMESRMD